MLSQLLMLTEAQVLTLSCCFCTTVHQLNVTEVVKTTSWAGCRNPEEEDEMRECRETAKLALYDIWIYIAPF